MLQPVPTHLPFLSVMSTIPNETEIPSIQGTNPLEHSATTKVIRLPSTNQRMTINIIVTPNTLNIRFIILPSYISEGYSVSFCALLGIEEVAT
jgi:hypothetical protein